MPPRVSGDSIPHDIWERIAFFANVSDEASSFLGPPSAISSLALLSRRVHEAVSQKSNPHLYAKIFRYKFDVSAATRRFSERWLTSRCLTSELVKRSKALKRIKAGQFDVKDLWTAYLMILEDDGKNKAQLLEYAGFDKYLRSVIIYRIGSSDDSRWFRNPTVDTLVLWLLWSISDRDQPRREPHEYRECLIGILHSVVISGYRHPSVYASDRLFTLPLVQEHAISTPGMLSPPVCELIHYSHPLKIVAPVISSVATLLLALQTEAFQDETSFPHAVRNELPLTRADAVAQGRTGPTVEDIEHFHYNVRIPTARGPLPSIIRPPNRHFDGQPMGMGDGLAEGSERYDSDWYRLVACHDIRVGNECTLRGVIYTPGSMTGSWEGRLMRADYALYASLLRSQTAPSTISIRHTPLYWELREHHCLAPNEPLEPGLDAEGGDDILNAWLPRGAVFTHLELPFLQASTLTGPCTLLSQDAVEVLDPNTGHTARYDTFIPRSTAPYSKPAMAKVAEAQTWISGGEIAENSNPIRSVFGSTGNPDSCPPSPSTTAAALSFSIDNDDEFVDTVSHLSSGVSDILITGKTGERYAPAWGDYTIHGRVRPWDGLVALLRFPTNPEERYLGTWVFKGYLHDGNFVGRWRETSTPVNLIGYEGSFVVYRNDPLCST
ncbi:hypothetical protein NLJ89_g1083 [Agrocybe chaxingu]|uniref:F-box domain-containing protein n=1 Tax=Agrocybe chaxingu TaxID=84603 RepID=A0A9W8N0M2_9AGAR|nr:hypothetical protein NLJ89_g1083 [Agrocybe chaxingu]